MFDLKIDNIYAHINKEAKETLYQHSMLTQYYYNKIDKTHNYTEILTKMINEILIKEDKQSKETSKFISDLIIRMLYYHDIGKIGLGFQQNRMDNKLDEKYIDYTYHSELSALLFIDIEYNNIKEYTFSNNRKQNNQTKTLIKDVLLRLSFLIKCHHTGLYNFDKIGYIEDLKILQDKINNNPKIIKYYDKDNINIDFSGFGSYEYKEDNLIQYVFYKFLYSILITCDSFATHHFFINNEVELSLFDEKLIKECNNKYQSTDIYKNISNYKKDNNYFEDTNINKTRCDIFLETEENLTHNLDKNIYFLEACTGSGKTNISQNLALQLLINNKTLNKIIYTFPFNTLIEQTKGVLYNNFSEANVDIVAINSIEEIKNNDEDYDNDLLKYQFLQYPITLTSHINLFSILFGYGRRGNLAFSQICNSVIILDEIQSYNHLLWNKMIEIFNILSEFLNVKFVIMSATLPTLDLFLEECKRDSVCKLINDTKRYYDNPIFKERVSIDFSMLENESITIDDVENKIDDIIKDDTKGNRILVEFITVNSADEMYDRIKSKYNDDFLVFELTNQDNQLYRKYVINKLNEKDDKGDFKNKNVVVISTQVIEAGVDIDMEVGLKDISILESEEQFLGRINRNGKDKGYAYFFSMDKTKNTYRGDFRVSYDLKNEDIQQCLTNKDFTQYYLKCINHLKDESQKQGNNNLNEFNDNLVNIKFKAISESMKLIENKSVQLYLIYKYKTKDGKIINSADILEEYKELKSIPSYAERMIKESKLKKDMNLFTYNFNIYDDKYPQIYSDIINNSLYIVENGQEYMEDTEEQYIVFKSKFNLKKYS
ncbi:CRISPR-associated protein Cas3 [Clostridium botulinum]|uniref:CRISPR-associated protein Cas3 n=2 Tax=Clostridium botulinum TaxID=1491 RepID=A0A9Q1ZBD1_CLOBO|nr:CRISPR-associated helicase/endonuclease Cas3 [Clostridium botulinum]AEB77228.1 CRISPR-associated protein Cas3 [Clostridium botulinum BKT015925]KLU74331.1 CRISPR-associated protein Cas3 [Clostridium botulinum V891]KOA80456.1 CRISPR-associated protein Cas3 [Clostridium botulinum]KOA81096.1 CRISPR-associated protein Cas3 [Clostridium botulinum]KOA84178.1 CRISPR-associated protein Cas3 [Clostridium botulinum]